MIFKKKEFFLFIFLILLQSCSGGRIGSFLENSFNDLEIISQDEDSKNNLENKKFEEENKEINDKDDEEIKKVEKQKNFLENNKDKNIEKSQKQKNNKNKNSTKNKNIELQSYKIIFILKDVDPKYPTEELSTILKNSEVNFEIEKIERILESKNKSINKK